MKSKHIKHKKWDWVSVIEDKRAGEQDHELQKEKEIKGDLKLENEITSDRIRVYGSCVASLPYGDGVVAMVATAKNLGLYKLDFALGK
ncbi:hypothetical protein LWI29_022030 [Acer saccharum]|uniref:Uncharacterized protein n=1 Tax=Acer saccharum TaxID=4024 RepID=A0AA39VJR2_ACESA|nr:hypothetical protein LWI29_022030 [Acer saccharum]